MSADEDPNKHVIEYLTYYCDGAHPLDFAVMLKGAWGAGKTHLINAFLESRKTTLESRSIYVSLYGVASAQDIDDQIFRQLHPILGSKGAKLAFNVFKGFLKTAVKIDIGGKNSVSVSSQLPEINISQYIVKPKESIIVFDDLERCSMPITSVLAYINTFVEHENLKVIIVAHEDEIFKKADDGETYRTVKEKLIGRTLDVIASAQPVIDEFIRSVNGNEARKLLSENVIIINDIYEKSKTQNLRILKQSLWDFERLAGCFTAEHWKHGEFLQTILRVTLAIAFEMRSARLTAEQLANLRVGRYLADARSKSTIGQLEARYPETDFDQRFLNGELLKEILFEGRVNEQRVREAIDKAPPFVKPEADPPWKRISGFWRTSEEEFDAAVLALRSQITNRELTMPGEMFQAFGLLLFLEEMGVNATTRTDIVEECKTYIDDLRAAGKIKDANVEQAYPELGGGYSGFLFASAGTAEFEQIRLYYENVVKTVAAERLPSHGARVLGMLRENPTRFSRMLCSNVFEASIYRDVPVLATIDGTEFVDTVLKMGPEDQSTAIAMFSGRYESGMLNRELQQEKELILKVKATFDQRIETLHPMVKFRLKSQIARYLQPHLGGGTPTSAAPS